MVSIPKSMLIVLFSTSRYCNRFSCLHIDRPYVAAHEASIAIVLGHRYIYMINSTQGAGPTSAMDYW